MKKILLLAAFTSMTACSAHLPSTHISDLDEVRAAIQTSKDAGAEKCAPKSQAKAVAAMYQAAHEITDEAGYHPEEDADLITSALKYAQQARDEAKNNCAKPKPVLVVIPKPIVRYVKPAPMVMKPKPVVKVPVKPVVLEVIALEGVYFASSSADLTSASSASLNDAVTVLQKRPDIQIEIAAYTDSRGKNSYNLALSKLRAHSVMNYFTSHGIKASRLSSQGYGEINPIADNATREGRAKNRRVELHVMK
ncbi:MAG: OmpA family protein [Zetaproteobacteria bacterium]|nr:OmpA family protein [Zetaproteobacteria bacterium]